MRYRVLFSLLLVAMPSCVTPGGAQAKRIEELERENAALKERVQELEKDLMVFRTAFGSATVCPPLIEAVVLEVKPDLELLVLDRGEKDGVKVGFVFDVYRGSTYKGQVRIQDVQETTSSGRIVHAMNPMANGDSATTQL